jgi:hypothetical protein
MVKKRSGERAKLTLGQHLGATKGKYKGGVAKNQQKIAKNSQSKLATVSIAAYALL